MILRPVQVVTRTRSIGMAYKQNYKLQGDEDEKGKGKDKDNISNRIAGGTKTGTKTRRRRVTMVGW